MNKDIETVLNTSNKEKQHKFSRNARAILSGLSLAFVSSLCVGLIMYTASSTEEIRENNKNSGLKAKISMLLPDEAKGDNIRLTCYSISKSKNVGHNQKIYVASKDLEIKGYVLTYSTSLGYSDPLIMIGGFTSQLASVRECPDS